MKKTLMLVFAGFSPALAMAAEPAVGPVGKSLLGTIDWVVLNLL